MNHPVVKVATLVRVGSIHHLHAALLSTDENGCADLMLRRPDSQYHQHNSFFRIALVTLLYTFFNPF